MNLAPVLCPRCHATLLGGVLNRPELLPCPSCGVPLQIEVFPALFRPPAPAAVAETVIVEGEATCFYHPRKRAIRPCDACGRFVCGLCDCEFKGRHLCPACLESGKTKGVIQNLEKSRVLYDSVALSVATLPVFLLFTIYFTFITAPMAVFIAVRHWNTSSSLVRRSRFRFVLAIIFASAQIIGWIAMITLIVRHRRHA